MNLRTDDAGSPRPAATVLVLRESSSTFEVFMVRRALRGFMAGAHVFPGGSVDPGDQSPALTSRCDLTAEEATLRLGGGLSPAHALALHVAAIRELFEEAGVLLAHPSLSGEPLSAGILESHRSDILQGSLSFEDLGAAHDLIFPASRLEYIGHWITPPVEFRRFDTRFFLTAATPDMLPSHDRQETIESRWLAPATALELAESGQIALAPPTMKTLELLAIHPTIDAALSWAHAFHPPSISPEFIAQDGQVKIILPGDPDSSYPEPVLPGATAYIMDQGRFRPAG